ncbi:MAG: CHAT domain-containing protein [Hormoscilla sp.]
MDEQRIDAYRNLIDALLQCPPEQRIEILQARPDLVDSGLVQVMEQVAAQMAEERDPNASWLREFATRLAASPTWEDYWNFLMEVLQAVRQNPTPEAVFPLLQQNLDKLDTNLWRVLQYFGETLQQREPETARGIAADIVNFSNLMCQFPLGDRAMNLEIAIGGYEICLTVFPPEEFPQEWATTQNNLGIAYKDRIAGERSENLERAIKCYHEALKVSTSEAFPVQWAGTQNNLGNAYLYRIAGERSENIERAIACYHDALKVYTPSALPVDWAMTQNNLGIAYSYRIAGEGSENLERAIKCYQEALKVYTPPSALPVDWAMTQNNLGTAYYERIAGERSENLEKAIACYHDALKVRTSEAFPVDWAATQNNLGNAYSDRIAGERSENRERAIFCYHDAQKVYTPSALPVDWAMTQNNLGNAYSDRIAGERSENLEKAIKCYHDALTVRTPTAFPLGCLQTGRNLGNIAFTAGFWETAIAGYAQAIEAVEKSRAWATTEERRQEILKESIGVFENMVQACVNTGQLDIALEYVERSRSQRLADLIAHNDLYAKGEIPPEIQEIIDAINQRQQQIDGMRSEETPQGDKELVGTRGTKRNRAALAARNEEIAALEAEKLQLRQQLYKLDPAIAGLHLNFTQLRSLIHQPTTAILSFYTTNDHTHIFILRQNQITCHTCTKQGWGTLQKWLWQNWLIPYCHEKETWKQQITSILRELSQRLHLNDLIAQHLEGISELILIPHIYLHQIPFAALPLGEDEYLGDKFLIRTLPSCQILDFCHQKRSPLAPLRKGGTGQVPLSKGDLGGSQTQVPLSKGDLGGSLTMGIVEDTKNDLPLTNWEAQTVAQLYDIPDARRLKGEKAKVSEYQKLLQQVSSLLSTHHAQSRIDNPLESALTLADGKITLGQMLTPGWRVPHLEEVFLSCCETNLGLGNITDDILTIGIGFLCAGVRSVISTLWAVDDLATAIFSIYYHQYRKGSATSPPLSRPEALQKAQQQLRILTQSEVQEMISEAERAVEQRADEVKKTSREEWRKLLIVAEKISQRQEKLKEFGEKPFASPQYWGAFICQGLP